MLSVFDFTDYRSYLRKRFEQMPKGGYGQGRKLAEHMGVHTSLVSQILKGQKEMSAEQGSACADFLGLNELETDYFLALLQWERAGTPLLKRTLQRQLKALKDRAGNLSQRTPYSRVLNEEQRAVFYSSWIYSAIRQCSAIKGGTSLDLIAATLQLPLPVAKQTLEFLLAAGLCAESRNKITIGPVRTFVERSSPWARVHHRNWRERIGRSLDSGRPTGFHYTSPVTLSAEDAERVRALFAEVVSQVDRVVDNSSSETLRCLCIDWFDPL